jgi:transcriptional regulator with XRE-family HTH domain
MRPQTILHLAETQVDTKTFWHVLLSHAERRILMKNSYRERDYAYGTAMLTLRTEIGLTQEGLANLLGVSRRAVGEWETGSSYPKVEHLKQLIALAVDLRAFSAGYEAEEIRLLWQVTHQKVLLDEAWLSALLGQRRSSHLHIVPSPTEKGMVGTSIGGQDAIETGSAQGTIPTAPGPRVDWDDAPVVPFFYGREQEQDQLTQWVVQEHYRVVSVLGMGGIGKSTLAINTMYRLAEHFEVVIFRSLHDAPSCEALLAECLQVFSPLPADEMPAEQAQGTGSATSPQECMEKRLNLLLSYLRRVRALVVLDNLECLLEDRDVRGHFRPGFEGYEWLLRRVVETTHQSCLLLTSREKPAELRLLECKYSLVHSLRLTGLDAAACQQLIEENGVVGSQQEQTQLIEVCSSNPLALKIVAKTIVELFGSEIGPFLASEPSVIFGSITDLLDEQFARLTDLEQTVLYWLAIMREPVTFDELLMLLAHPLLRVQVLEAVNSLRQRSLIERGKHPGSFTLQAVVLEYVTANLIAEAGSEIQQRWLDRLIQHGLFQAMACEHIRQAQERLLLFPLLTHLQCVYPERDEVEEQLLSLLDELRKWTDYAQGYGPANLIALLRLQRGHLSGLDLSHLSIRGACLQDIEMDDASLGSR